VDVIPSVMTDDLTATLAAFATGDRTAELTGPVIRAVVTHLVDGLGCAIGAAGAAPSRIARGLAAPTAGPSSVPGLATGTIPELAAFATTCMIRHLDFNDSYSARTGGHPSDTFGGILAMAEASGASGADVIVGGYVAYEVFGALADGIALRARGWDHGALIAVAATAGIAAATGMDARAAAHAIALVVTSAVPLRVGRAGRLSEWKGCATAHSVLNATLMCRLAAAGLTGPDQPFRGAHGFVDQVSGDFDLDLLARPGDGPRVVERSSLKSLPVEGAAQAPLEVFLRLAQRVGPSDIAAITITAHDFLYQEIGGGRDDHADKWDPQTRETADHSLPYLVAVALSDGAVGLDSFRPERVLDPQLRPLMNRITIRPWEHETGTFPWRQPVHLDIEFTDGTHHVEECEFPLGHRSRPMPEAVIDDKFRGLCTSVIGTPRTERLLEVLHELPEAASLAALTAAVRATADSNHSPAMTQGGSP
jgi:2-methylcitrate dehydratase